jgi:hypothetical protein
MTNKDSATLLNAPTVAQRHGRPCFADVSNTAPNKDVEGSIAFVLDEEVAEGEPEFVDAWLST